MTAVHCNFFHIFYPMLFYFKRILFSLSLILLNAAMVFGQSALKMQANDNIEREANYYETVAKSIWREAELGYHEHKSQAALMQVLQKAGFDVQKNIADIPTAFIGSYGSGKPVIGILAEYDALPGLSQDTVPYKKAIEGQGSGHACGHHLLGTAAVAAAVEIKKLLAAGKLKGTVRVFGTPAEEGGSGKVFMVRGGVFRDVDAVLHWHPDDKNAVMHGTSLANISAKFRFKGIASHAAASPEKGRSALDGVEAFNYMVNLMREHVPSNARIHYIITNGGAAPNIVPDLAEAYYYVRSPDQATVKEIFARIVEAAKGAAMGTGTTMDFEIQAGVYNIFTNYTIAQVIAKNFKSLGGYRLDERELDFSKKMQETIQQKPVPLSNTQKVDTTLDPDYLWQVSTDVGDVSWNVPAAGFSTATWMPGTAAHSWQATACGGMSIGMKGMILAAKLIAYTAIDLMEHTELLKQAKTEFIIKRGKDFIYMPLVGERTPPFDYRKK